MNERKVLSQSESHLNSTGYRYSMNYGMNIDELVNCALLCIIVQIQSDFLKEHFRSGFLFLGPFHLSVFNVPRLVELVDLSQCARKSLGTIIFMTAVGTWRAKEENS